MIPIVIINPPIYITPDSVPSCQVKSTGFSPTLEWMQCTQSYSTPNAASNAMLGTMLAMSHLPGTMTKKRKFYILTSGA